MRIISQNFKLDIPYDKNGIIIKELSRNEHEIECIQDGGYETELGLYGEEKRAREVMKEIIKSYLEGKEFYFMPMK